MATGKARTTRKSTKSAGKTKTRSAPRKTKTPKSAAKRTTKVAKRAKASPTKKPKTKAKSTRKPAGGKTVAKSSTKVRAVRKKSASKANRTARTGAPAGKPPPVTVQWGAESIELAVEGRAIPRTKLTKKELREFKELLLAKRRELVGDVLNLTDQALRGNSTRGGSSVPLHMADVGSDNWEQEFALGLIENERALVREIDEALDRIAVRTYGICIATHRPIETARLRAKPWAKYCVEYARLRELGRVP